MKKTLSLTLFLLAGILSGYGGERDSLLRVLDETINRRSLYIRQKEAQIAELKRVKAQLTAPIDRYRQNTRIIGEYESFVCDSAEKYIRENIRLAEQMDDRPLLDEAKLRLAFVYSLSGLFVQAEQQFSSVDFASLPDYLKVFYGWNIIRYYENLIKYTGDTKFTVDYERRKEAFRDTVMTLLGKDSPEYRKEQAFKLQYDGRYAEAIALLMPIFRRSHPDTHTYAMEAMGLAKNYRLWGKHDLEERYLLLAAITDARLSVEENEALLTLSANLYRKGDVTRAYNYVKAAMADAAYYNSRFRNTVIARVHPIIENSYLQQIEKQRKSLRLFTLLMALFVLALAVTLYFNYRQIKLVSKARRNLKRINEKLSALNVKLDEANLVKEKYIGYFMNQCAVYVNRLDEFRKLVNRKVKTGQLDELHKLSSRPFEKEIEELYGNFDTAFLELYPHFIDGFNALLQPSERFRLAKGQLNTELRIFALIRLGITDMGQIATFLHYSVQTIYNYKSKVKRSALPTVSNLDEAVMKLGILTE
jgi:hypothetical protein